MANIGNIGTLSTIQLYASKNDEPQGAISISALDNITSQLFLQEIRKQMPNNKYQVMTIAWGAGGALHQIIPNSYSYTNAALGKSNLILSFDGNNEGFASALTSGGPYNMTNLLTYIKEYCPQYGNCIESTVQLVNLTTNPDKNFTSIYRNLIDATYEHGNMLEEFEAICAQDGTQSSIIGFRDYFKDKFQTEFQNSIEKFEMIVTTGDTITTGPTDKTPNKKHIIAEGNTYNKHGTDDRTKSSPIYCKLVKLKFQKGNIFTTFTIMFILDDIYAHNIKYIVDKIFTDNVKKILLCSVRAVDCICEYQLLDDEIKKFDHIYLAHGEMNAGYVKNTTGAEIYNYFKQNGDPIDRSRDPPTIDENFNSKFST